MKSHQKHLVKNVAEFRDFNRKKFGYDLEPSLASSLVNSDIFIHISLLVSTSLVKEYFATLITQHGEVITHYYVIGFDGII